MEDAAESAKLGPGAFVAVVGPSGAGKDTLLALARAELAGTSAVVFPRRVVTRPPSPEEDHESLTATEFVAARAAGAFAFFWHAHGLDYALPSAIMDDLRAGRTVVCNVSRAVVTEVRARCARCAVVLVTAPPEILRARLAARGREMGEDMSARIARRVEGHALAVDLVIENVGDPRHTVRPLVDLLRR